MKMDSSCLSPYLTNINNLHLFIAEGKWLRKTSLMWLWKAGNDTKLINDKEPLVLKVNLKNAEIKINYL